MRVLTASLAVLALASGKALAEGEHAAPSAQVLQAPAAPRTSNYGEEYSNYDYSNYQENPYPVQQEATAADRQGVEGLIAAPLIVTAFSAALFGGLLSPAITYGFERMAEYEIKWPEFTRKKSSGKSRALDAFSWLETLETVGKIVEEIQSTNKGSFAPSQRR